MKRFALVSIAIIITFSLVPSIYAQTDENPAMEGFNTEGSDARAIEIADAVMQSMGGRKNWDNTRYLSWGFGRGEQIWDKWSGEFRYQQDSLVVLMNVNSKEGRAWADGEEIADKDDVLAGAYRAWVNSGYWFIMPYKLKDSGVTLKYVGESTTEDERPAEMLQLTFESVGLTPQNKYHVYVDKETMLVSQWSFFRNASDAESSWTRPWGNWKQYGNIMLSDFRGEGRNGPFILPNVGAYDELPEHVFTDPNRIDLGVLQQ
ncbi:MAG: hypothetical protein AB8G77_07400 [Rhodothermales bacterium]